MIAVDWPAWITAFGTVGVVVVALVLAGQESRRARRRDERHQAELITAWVDEMGFNGDDKPFTRVGIHNASNQSAYQVISSLVAVQGAWPREAPQGDERYESHYRIFLWQLPPGRWTKRMEGGGRAMMIRWGIEIAFQDAAGRYWRRFADGRLERIKENPVDFYKVSRPIGWEDTVRLPE